MHRSSLFIAAFAALAGTASAAHIDFFNEGPGPLVLADGSPSLGNVYADPDPITTPAILGNVRSTTVNASPGPADGVIVAAMTQRTGAGLLSFSNGADTRGTLVLSYFGSVGDGNVQDIAASPGPLPYDAFRLDVASLDGSFNLLVRGFDTSGNVEDLPFGLIATTGPTFVPYSFSTVDPASLDRLDFVFTAVGVADDIALDGIFRATTVPEPTAALATAALGGLVALRRRR